MATINADTRFKDALIKKEVAVLAQRVLETKTLTILVAGIPKVKPEVVSDAVEALLEAADLYKADRPILDIKGRRSKPGIAEARASVAALQKSLCAVQQHLSGLPLTAFTELTDAYDAPMGRLKADVAQVCKATETALKSLRAKPDKAPDHARNVLAYQVAVVFRDILDKKPSSASDKSLNVTNKRGGAAYARVLRATLKISGVSDYDPGPLITTGLKLLKDPELP